MILKLTAKECWNSAFRIFSEQYYNFTAVGASYSTRHFSAHWQILVQRKNHGKKATRDANKEVDKSQHAALRPASWNSFIWNGVSFQASRRESRRLAERARGVAAVAACMAAQTLTSGSSLLRAHSDRPNPAKLNLSPLIPAPMAHSNCHPSLCCQRWRDES